MPVKRFVVDKIFEKEFDKIVVFKKSVTFHLGKDCDISVGDFIFFDNNDNYMGFCNPNNYTQDYLKENIEKRVLRLVHFTNVLNLENIKKYGLCSLEQLKKRGISYHNNDSHRMDGQEKGVCLTLSNENMYVLNAFIRNNPGTKYTTLYIKPNILFDLFSNQPKFRVYYNHNAAARYAKSSIFDIEVMFEESFNIKTYDSFIGDWVTSTFTRNNKAYYETTSSQAEIIIYDGIPVEYIYIDPEFKTCIKDI